MRIPSYLLLDARLSKPIKLSGILASISIFTTILMANGFPLSWVALWPAAFSALPTSAFLFLSSLRVIASVEKSRRRSQERMGAYAPSINEKLDDLSRELEELEDEMARLDSKVCTRTVSRRAPMRLA